MWTLHTKLPTHWVPLSTVSSFKRMRPYMAHLGIARIAEGLKDSKSRLLEVEQEEGKENEWRVRRREDPKEPVGVWERSVYAVCSDLFFVTWMLIVLRKDSLMTSRKTHSRTFSSSMARPTRFG